MSVYNYFGTSFSRVIEFYPDTIAKDFGGEEIILDELARVARKVASSLTPTVYQQMTEPDLQLIVRRATAGQSTAQLGLYPIIAGSVRLWRINQGAVRDPLDVPKPMPGYGETSGTTNATTGAITGIPPMDANDQMYASYQVDVDAATFDMPSMGEICAMGAAANLGPRLYARGSELFEAVKELGERFNKTIDLMLAGTWIPDELRQLRWWNEIERSSSQIASIDLLRG